MDKDTLLAGLDFTRGRLLGVLGAIEKSGQDTAKVLAWRPGPGRAHIGWQAMHCAATHDRYLNGTLLGKALDDESLVTNFAGGSEPSDENVPTLAAIREKLEREFRPFRDYVAGLDTAGLTRKTTARDGTQRSVGESIVLLTWHEAHHQGQIHLTWNLYKAAHGLP